jgi:hypothetical protein
MALLPPFESTERLGSFPVRALKPVEPWDGIWEPGGRRYRLGRRGPEARLRGGTPGTRDLIRFLIRVNFGEDALDLCPKAVLAKFEQQDQTERI